MQMNLLGNDFLVFTNAASHEVNVVYRRGDGTYGLIETGAQRRRRLRGRLGRTPEA